MAANVSYIIQEKESVIEKRSKVYSYLDVVSSKKITSEKVNHINKNALLKYYSNLLFLKD